MVERTEYSKSPVVDFYNEFISFLEKRQCFETYKKETEARFSSDHETLFMLLINTPIMHWVSMFNWHNTEKGFDFWRQIAEDFYHEFIG